MQSCDNNVIFLDGKVDGRKKLRHFKSIKKTDVKKLKYMEKFEIRIKI